MIVAIIAGFVCGAGGFIPLFIGLRMTRKVTRTSNFGSMAILLISLLISFALLFLFAVICTNVARDLAMAFTLSEAVGLSLSAIAFGIVRLKRS